MGIVTFLLQWVVTALCLWVVAHLISGFQFRDTQTLLVSSLVLGFVNAIIRPVFVFFTLPLTFLTLGLFLSHSPISCENFYLMYEKIYMLSCVCICASTLFPFCCLSVL